MRLRAYDTVHVSSVKSENLRPGEEFEVPDADGEVLLKAHPGLFAIVEGKSAPAPANKAEPEPENKEAAPISAPTRRTVPRR